MNHQITRTLKEYLHLTTDQPGPKIRFCLNHRTHPLLLKSPNTIGSLFIYPPPNLFLLPKPCVYSPLGQACQLGLPLKMEGRIPLNRVLVGLLLWYCGSQHGISGHKRSKPRKRPTRRIFAAISLLCHSVPPIPLL